MEWLAMSIWVILAGLALPLAPRALTTPGAGLAAIAPFVGLVLTVVFVTRGGSSAVAWALVGVAGLGILGAGLAHAGLSSAGQRAGTAGQHREEPQAIVVAMQLPLLVAAVPVAVGMALGLLTVR